jgi:putative redox protein
MKVKVTQQSDFHFIGTGEDFPGHQLLIDAAATVGGKGRGFRPPGLLMYSIAGCMGIHTYEALHQAGKVVDAIEVETDGERRDEHPKIFTTITLKFRLRGATLTDRDVQDAIRTALTKTCSIAVMANMVAPITCEYRVEGGTAAVSGTVTAPAFTPGKETAHAAR